MAFSVVQSKKAVTTGAITSGAFTIAFTSNLTAGNLIWIAIAVYGQNNQTSELSDAAKPTDTLLHTYTGVGPEQVYNGGNEFLRCFYVPNISAGANTVTINLDHTLGATGLITVVIAECSGIATSSPLDIQNSNLNDVAGTSATTTSTNATTNANDVILAAVADTSGANPTTFTRGDSASDILDETNGAANQPLATSSNVKAATGSYAATWTISSSKYGAQMGAFKLAISQPWLNNSISQPLNFDSAMSV